MGCTAEVVKETVQEVFGVSSEQRKEDKKTWCCLVLDDGVREYKKVFKRRDLQRKSVMVKKTKVDMSSRKRVYS